MRIRSCILGAILSVVLATASGASLDTVQLSASTALYPAFAPTVSDYVVRCTGTAPVQVTVANSDPADTTTRVTVDGQPLAAGGFTAQVSLAKGQRFQQWEVADESQPGIAGIPNGRLEMGGTNWEIEFAVSVQAKPTLLIP